jgi:serine/threonine protein kinase
MKNKFGGLSGSKLSVLGAQVPSDKPYNGPFYLTRGDIIYSYYESGAISTDEYTTIYFGEALNKRGKKLADIVIKIVKKVAPTEVNQLKNESLIVNGLAGTPVAKYIPARYDFIAMDNSPEYILVSERVGPSLESLLKKYQTFSINSCLSVLYQGLEALAALHDTGFSHEDIKTGNMCIGLRDPQNLKLIDLGISIKYMVSKNAYPRFEDPTNGTPYYVSPDVWYGKGTTPVSRKHDLQSLLYVVLELYHGDLPWKKIKMEGINISKVPAARKQIADAKEAFIVELIYSTLDPVFIKILVNYYSKIWELHSFETPPYAKLMDSIKKYPGFTRNILLNSRN